MPHPVALVIKGDQTDWNKLRDLDVDGFIPEEARNMELMAHFQAIAHRSICQINKTKILIIEDDEQIQETLKLSFQIYWPEVEVSFATRGEEGVRMARCESVDVILLELILPDISGLDVLNKIRSFTQTPVVILTADRNQETLIKALRSGANDYVLKPFKQIELMNRLRQFINQGATVS